MEIKVREITEGCKFEIINKGEWIDLCAAANVELRAPQAGVQYEKDDLKFRDVSFDYTLVPLGIAMEIPEGYEAHIVPRSSTFKKRHIIQGNHLGVVDSSYSGNNDEWKMSVISMAHTTIKKGDRICQFRIQLSQKATFWQKIKWLFNGRPKFVWVNKLDNTDRGGFGTTGI